MYSDFSYVYLTLYLMNNLDVGIGLEFCYYTVD